MTQICEGCKGIVKQCIPHGRPVKAVMYGCRNRYPCSAYDICDYFTEMLKVEGLLRKPSEIKEHREKGGTWDD
jgi:hypothetical protein